MEHGKKTRKFGRTSKLRKELMRDLAQSLIFNGKIMTTQAKAKSLRPYIEKAVTKSKTSSIATTRLLISDLGKKAAMKLTKEIGPKFEDQKGGYTTISNLPRRISDGARMAMIQFIK